MVIVLIAVAAVNGCIHPDEGGTIREQFETDDYYIVCRHSDGSGTDGGLWRRGWYVLRAERSLRQTQEKHWVNIASILHFEDVQFRLRNLDSLEITYANVRIDDELVMHIIDTFVLALNTSEHWELNPDRPDWEQSRPRIIPHSTQ